MKTRLIRILAIATILCVIGLIYVQVRWIQSAATSEEANFKGLIDRTLIEVVGNIEEKEMLLALSRIRHSGFPVIDTISFILHKEDHTSGIQCRGYLLSLAHQLSDTLRKKIRSFDALSVMEQKSFLQSMLPFMVDVTEPIEQRLSKEEIEDFIKQAFQNKEINLPFEFAVSDEKGEIKIQSDGYEQIVPLNNNERYSTRLFQRAPSYLSNYYNFTLYVPYKTNYIIRSLRILIYVTLFLMVVIVLLSTVTLATILRQKHLAEIKDDFIGNVTHELKTPIATISLAGQMLENPSIGAQPERVASLSSIILTETKRLSSLVERVLQISMFAKGKIKLKKKEIDMHELILKILDRFSLQFNKHQIEVETNLSATRSLVLGDESHLTEVLSNLIDNAIKYRKDEISLKISIKSVNKGTDFELTISDNGIGIATEHLKHIFEKFYRVPHKNIHNIKGFGLGLNYVSEIVTMHGGTLWAKSELGKGSTFGLTLPVLE